MWKHLFLLLASFFPIAVCAQVKEPFDKYIAAVSQPGLGEVVPDLRFHNVLNYKKQQVRLSEFKGKAILIDFWASFCQPCLAQFPKLQGIQDKFQKELQVITITSDQQEKIVHMFNNIRSQGFKMLTATNDAKGSNDIIFSTFPHKYIPHYVWIDKNQVLKAVTGYEELTEDNIAKLIAGNSLSDVNHKTEDILNMSHPALFTYQELGMAEKMMLNDSIAGLLEYSMLSGYNKKYPPSSGIDFTGIYAERRIRLWNLPLCTMLRLAFGKLSTDPREQELVPMPRVFFNIRDKAILDKLLVNFTEAPDSTSDMYCYDLIVNKKGMRSLQDKMKEDLYKYFGVRGTHVKKKIACYVLTMKDSLKLTASDENYHEEGNMYYLKLKNTPFPKLVQHIKGYNENSKSSPYRGLESAIIIDETHFVSRIDINLTVCMNDIPALKSALAQYGIELCEDERMVDVLLLED
ncbi:TlpA family protein disulfide reductase [Chitinophaga pinensis]|uniref:Alkyl hydroperoxide reductase/ Thiol specific antioxidant/ Mal allergen n=1 Tax=Chitinophaga pinensis (strain ATCC 43595 / DSM 2588 / LMG 13176 / NBRC 15968 / NCIMB 11800 / UQM 2034) TaxID=485918 RepID=A0A979G2J9_CHIPD|nr:TlpA disulfide reductase family protein [Chitinophaga pinensis]ACU59757.1 alkyl hydroperoxide reductase/ Thiol specific antioxidant/ Mal allergen [Chitinophaga pinensis DSM 2588]